MRNVEAVYLQDHRLIAFGNFPIKLLIFYFYFLFFFNEKLFRLKRDSLIDLFARINSTIFF